MKKIIASLLVAAILMLTGTILSQKSSAKEYPFELNAKSAVLMDATTGEVLFEQNADTPLPPASVTKIMTLLLVMEAISAGKVALDDLVTVSAGAASMGGSQVYLEEGEQMKVEELLKCVVIASANDAAYALAEHIAGSEEAFIRRMNLRAEELGMKNTYFETCTGLDDSTVKHLTSARDIALMSKELLKHDKIFDYTTIWQDTIRNGSFTLTNTNRLVRFYPGATGLKTGSTAKALFCISATAKRDGLHLIAVIMGSPTRDIRNAEAKKLLDYGFAEYSAYAKAGEELAPLSITGSGTSKIAIEARDFSALLHKGEEKKVTCRSVLPNSLQAPVEKGAIVGYLEYTVDGRVIGKADVVAKEGADRISFLTILNGLFRHMIGVFSVE